MPSPGDNVEVPLNDGYIFNAELLACLRNLVKRVPKSRFRIAFE